MFSVSMLETLFLKSRTRLVSRWGRGAWLALSGLSYLLGNGESQFTQSFSIFDYGKLPRLVMWAVLIRTLCLIVSVLNFPNFVSTSARYPSAE